MTTAQAHDFLFDPKKFGKSVSVNFYGVVRKWLKSEFSDYRKAKDDWWEGESYGARIRVTCLSGS
jgi:hypothetical protein